MKPLNGWKYLLLLSSLVVVACAGNAPRPSDMKSGVVDVKPPKPTVPYVMNAWVIACSNKEPPMALPILQIQIDSVPIPDEDGYWEYYSNGIPVRTNGPIALRIGEASKVVVEVPEKDPSTSPETLILIDCNLGQVSYEVVELQVGGSVFSPWGEVSWIDEKGQNHKRKDLWFWVGSPKSN